MFDKIVAVLGLIALCLNMSPAFAAPDVFEARAVCNSNAVQQIYEARNKQHHDIAYWWRVSQAARSNTPDVNFKEGLVATIVISGVTNAGKFAGAELILTDRNSKKMDRVVKVTKVTSESIVLEKVDLGDGIMNIHIPGVAWGTPEVQVHPIGWKGVGVSYDKVKNVFSASYRHRLNNSAIMPEMLVVCSS